jgi:hypothetical protein
VGENGPVATIGDDAGANVREGHRHVEMPLSRQRPPTWPKIRWASTVPQSRQQPRQPHAEQGDPAGNPPPLCQARRAGLGGWSSALVAEWGGCDQRLPASRQRCSMSAHSNQRLY